MNAPPWLVARPIAHRGLHDSRAGIFENTLAAAEAAIAGGFAIECDVQDTADGEAVVFHDHTLERLTGGHGSVRERDAAELTALAVAATQDRIPTLEAFLARVAGRVPVIVEIKSRFAGDERPGEADDGEERRPSLDLHRDERRPERLCSPARYMRSPAREHPCPPSARQTF